MQVQDTLSDQKKIVKTEIQEVEQIAHIEGGERGVSDPSYYIIHILLWYEKLMSQPKWQNQPR